MGDVLAHLWAHSNWCYSDNIIKAAWSKQINMNIIFANLSAIYLHVKSRTINKIYSNTIHLSIVVILKGGFKLFSFITIIIIIKIIYFIWLCESITEITLETLLFQSRTQKPKQFIWLRKLAPMDTYWNISTQNHWNHLVIWNFIWRYFKQCSYRIEIFEPT